MVPAKRESAPEWAARVALLEKAAGDLTLAKVVALLLDIGDGAALNALQTHENNISRKGWHNAYAMGADYKGNLVWGGGYRLRNANDASQTALAQCVVDRRDWCIVIQVDGDFRKSDFLEMARRLVVPDIAASRQVFLNSLTRPAPEVRVGLAAVAGGGTTDSNYSFGYSSVRE